EDRVISVKDPDPGRVGRPWSNKVVEMALASYPGFFMTHVPTAEQQVGVYWPALVPSSDVEQFVVIGEARLPVPPAGVATTRSPVGALPPPAGPTPSGPHPPDPVP